MSVENDTSSGHGRRFNPSPTDLVAYFIARHCDRTVQCRVSIANIMQIVRSYTTRMLACIILVLFTIAMYFVDYYAIKAYVVVSSIIITATFAVTSTKAGQEELRCARNIFQALLVFFWYYRIWILNERRDFSVLRRQIELRIFRLLTEFARREKYNYDTLEKRGDNEELKEKAERMHWIASQFMLLDSFATIRRDACEHYESTETRLKD